MKLHTCPSCGAMLGVPEEQTVIRCRGCDLAMHLDRLDEGRSVTRLLAEVNANLELPGPLRFRIAELLRSHLEHLDESALRASASEPMRPSGPPPLPVIPKAGDQSAGTEESKPAEDLLENLGGIDGEPAATTRSIEPGPSVKPHPHPTLPTDFSIEDPAAPPLPADAPLPRREVPLAPSEPREPSLWSRLGPAFTENILFALAAFLLVAGAVYFVTTAWTTMTGEQRLLVVVGGLELLGGVLYTLGRLLNRGGSLPEVERTLLIVVCFMVPVAAAAAGELLTVSLLPGMLASAAVLGPGYLLARDLGRVSDAALRPVLPFALIGMTFLVLLAGTGEQSPALATFAGTLMLVVACRTHLRSLVPRLGPNVAPALWSTLLLAFVATVFTGVVTHSAWRFGIPPGQSLPPIGILLSALSVITVMLEHALSRAGRLEAGRSPALLVGALGLAATGVVVALAYDQTLLAAALFAAGGALVAGYRLPSPALLLPGLLFAGMAYLKLPAPVREFAIMVRDEAAGALGYQPERLPFAYYGVTFLPYLALCGAGGIILERIGRGAHSRVVLWWTLIVAGGLCLQAMIMCRGDYRAPAAVFFAEGAMLLLLARLARDRTFVGAGIALVFAGESLLLHRLGVPTSTHVLAMAITGLGVLFIARRLRAAGDGFALAAADTLTDLTGVMAVIVVAALGFGHASGTREAVALTPAGAFDIPAVLLLGFLLTALGAIYRNPIGLVLAILLLARGLTGAMNAMGLDPHGVWRMAVFSFGSAAPLLLYRVVPFIPDRRKLLEAADPLMFVPGGIVALQVLGAIPFGDPDVQYVSSVAHVIGLGGGAVVLTVAAMISRRNWITILGVIEVFIAGPVLARVLGFEIPSAATALGAALSLALIRGGAFLAERREQARRLLLPILARSIAPLGALLLIWLTALLTDGNYRHSGGYDGVHLAGAALIVVVIARLTRFPEALLVGGLILPLVPIGLLDQMAARVDLYPLAILLAAGVATIWSNHRKITTATTLTHLSLAFGLATIYALSDQGNPGILFLTFLMLAAAGRMIARMLPIPGSLMMVFSALIGIPVLFFHRGLKVDLDWQPLILLLLATGTLLAARAPTLRMHRGVSRSVAIPFIAAAGAFFIMHAVTVLATAPSTDLDKFVSLKIMVLTALAFLGSVISIGRFGRILPWFALLLFFHVAAPFNIVIEGSYGRFWRPDVETALIAVVLALTLSGRSGKRDLFPCLFAGIALLFTVGDLRHLSTPLTVLAATTVAMVLLVRFGGRAHADLASNGLIATAFAIVMYAVPESGRPMAEILTVLSATAAVMLIGLLGAGKWLGGGSGGRWRTIAASRCRRAAAHAACLAILCALANVVFLHARPAEMDLILLIAFAMITVGIVALRVAREDGMEHLVHGAMSALLVLYAFLATRTGALDLLEGYHFHAMAVIGAFVLTLARGRLAGPLAIEGVILPIPVVLISLTGLFGVDGFPGRAASGFFLAGAACGLAANRLRLSALWGVAGVLLNLALFSIWRHQGIVDPAFYGVPPGLSFLVAAELLRRRVSAIAHLQMFILGSVLLYGSVGIQVLRVEEPTHALVLFALGILSVVLGFVLRRNELLVAGTSVVVLDVIAYLARHGFEEGFLGAALLVLAGLTVLTVATMSTLRRRKGETGGDPDRDS